MFSLSLLEEEIFQSYILVKNVKRKDCLNQISREKAKVKLIFDKLIYSKLDRWKTLWFELLTVTYTGHVHNTFQPSNEWYFIFPQNLHYYACKSSSTLKCFNKRQLRQTWHLSAIKQTSFVFSNLLVIVHIPKTQCKHKQFKLLFWLQRNV